MILRPLTKLFLGESQTIDLGNPGPINALLENEWGNISRDHEAENEVIAARKVEGIEPVTSSFQPSSVLRPFASAVSDAPDFQGDLRLKLNFCLQLQQSRLDDDSQHSC